MISYLWTHKNWRQGNVDLEKSGASFLAAGSRSTIPHRKKKKKLTKNIGIIFFRKKSNSRLLVNLYYSVPNHYFDGFYYS